jgi:hypothetical protein
MTTNTGQEQDNISLVTTNIQLQIHNCKHWTRTRQYFPNDNKHTTTDTQLQTLDKQFAM